MAVKKIDRNDFYFLALKFTEEFAKTTFKTFICDDVRTEFEKKHSCDIDGRVWGRVFKELSKQGKIHFFEFKMMKIRKSHSCPTSVWISNEYSERQSKNSASRFKDQTKIDFDGQS